MPTTRSKEGTTPKQVARPRAPRAKSVAFRFPAPDAQRVTLAGEFNAWDADAQPMRRGKDGVWSTSLKLKPGRYEYKLVVDGVWQEDHTNPNRAWTPEGQVNSVVEVS